MVLIDKEVRFDIWCSKCQYADIPEADEPCAECLEYPSNEHSTKPVNFKEMENRK